MTLAPGLARRLSRRSKLARLLHATRARPLPFTALRTTPVTHFAPPGPSRSPRKQPPLHGEPVPVRSRSPYCVLAVSDIIFLVAPSIPRDSHRPAGPAAPLRRPGNQKRAKK